MDVDAAIERARNDEMNAAGKKCDDISARPGKMGARSQRMMEEKDLDALVVRAPDNILYLTNYWTMKGYDIAVFPREGDPTLLVVEPQFHEAQRTRVE